MHRIKITLTHDRYPDRKAGDSRTVDMDGAGFEYGHDIHGRCCRVAQHSIKPDSIPERGAVITSGNRYEREA